MGSKIYTHVEYIVVSMTETGSEKLMYGTSLLYWQILISFDVRLLNSVIDSEVLASISGLT